MLHKIDILVLNIFYMNVQSQFKIDKQYVLEVKGVE